MSSVWSWILQQPIPTQSCRRVFTGHIKFRPSINRAFAQNCIDEHFSVCSIICELSVCMHACRIGCTSVVWKLWRSDFRVWWFAVRPQEAPFNTLPDVEILLHVVCLRLGCKMDETAEFMPGELQVRTKQKPWASWSQRCLPQFVRNRGFSMQSIFSNFNIDMLSM